MVTYLHIPATFSTQGKIHAVVFWVMTHKTTNSIKCCFCFHNSLSSCNLCFPWGSSLLRFHVRWRQHDPPKLWYPIITLLHDVITRKTARWILIAFKISSLADGGIPSLSNWRYGANDVRQPEMHTATSLIPDPTSPEDVC